MSDDATSTGFPAAGGPDLPEDRSPSETGSVLPRPLAEADRIAAWLRGRLPAEWTATGGPEVTVDRDEITVIVTVAADGGPGEQGELAEEQAAGRITRFREDTRQLRIGIAQEAERRYGRRVAWGARCGEVVDVFTNLAVPVMTRLRQPERMVLDTLVEAGVARSRAHAVAWCVRLVGKHSGEWLGDLRRAMAEVERVREGGPTAA